ncbi:MAG: hypothetical protein ACLR7D_07130 [Lachnospira eligens]
MGKYIYTYIENGQMYDKSPSLAELLAKGGAFLRKNSDWQDWLYSCGESFEKIKMHGGLCLRVKMLWFGFAYNMGECELSCGVKIAVVGKKTQEALRTTCGLEADFVSLQAAGLELGRV